MKILYLGSSGPLSVEPLRYLLASGHSLVAVGVSAGSDNALRELSSPVIAGLNESVEMLARIHNLPVLTLFETGVDPLPKIASLSPDLILVSCFENILPQAVLSMPVAGCYNLHPSLLPAFRGPVPLFWQFRQGIEQFGISLHSMTAQLDAGPVVAQRSTTMPDGVSHDEAAAHLAGLGVELVKELFDALDRQRLRTTPQCEAEASYMGLPRAKDFAVSSDWPARRIYNFMRATQNWGHTYPCKVMQRLYELEAALDYQSEPGLRSAFCEGDSIRFACRPGVLTARFKTDSAA